MIVYEEREQKQRTLAITSVVCDRCGGDVKRVHGIGVPRDFDGKGATVRGHLYPTHNEADARYVDAELCADCTDELVEWIDGGDGPGVRIRSAIEKSHDLSYNYRG